MLILIIVSFEPSLRWDMGSVYPCDNYYDTLYLGAGDRVLKITPSLDTLTLLHLPNRVIGVNIVGEKKFFWSKNELIVEKLHNLDTLHFYNSIQWATAIGETILISSSNKIYLYDSLLTLIDSLSCASPFTNFFTPYNDSIIVACSGGDGIFIYNIKSKSLLYQEDTPGYAMILCFYNSNIYEADREGGLRLYDINNDYSLSLVSTESGWASWSSIDTTSRLLAVSLSGISIYDISIPDTLNLISSISQNSYNLAITGNYLWNVKPYRTINLYDISQVSTPSEIGSFSSNGLPISFIQKDTLLIMVGSGVGCDFFKAKSGTTSFLGRFPSDINLYSASLVCDTVLFLPQYYSWKGLSSISISDPKNPYEIKNFPITAKFITPIKNDIFFISTWDDIQSYRFISPDSIELISDLPVYNAQHLTWVNNTIVASGNDSILYIIDASDPSNMVIDTALQLSNTVYNTDLKDSLMVTAEGAVGIKIWNIRNPNNPSLITTITGIDARKVLLWGKYLYTNTHNGYLYAYDISNILSPLVIDSFFYDDFPAGLSKGENQIFLGSTNRGFWSLVSSELDIFPPAPPKAICENVLRGAFWTSSESVAVIVSADEPLQALFLKYYSPPLLSSDTTHTYIYSDTIFLKYLKEGVDTVYIWATDSVGNVDYRFYSFFATGYDTTSPNPVNLLSPINGGYSSDTTLLIWSSSRDSLSGVKNYWLKLSLDSNFTSTILDTTIADTILIIHANSLPVETTLFWHISAFDSAGNQSNWSETRYFAIDTIPPSPPESIYVNGIPFESPWITSDTFEVNYTYKQYDFSGIMKSFIKINSPPISNYDTSFTESVNPFNYLFDGEGIETLYIWLEDSAGNLDYTNYSFFIIKRDTTPPSMISNIQVSPYGWSNSDTFVVKWQKPIEISGITSYFIKKDSPPISPYDTLFSSIAESLTFYTDTCGAILYYLWAEDSAGNNSYTNPSFFSIKRDTTNPSTPLLYKPDSGINYNAEFGISWLSSNDSYSGIEYYSIQMDTLPGIPSPFLSDTVDTAFYRPYDIPGMRDIYWRVQAVDSAKNASGWSNVWFFFNDNLSPFPPDSIIINGKSGISPWTYDTIFQIVVYPSESSSKGDTSGIRRVFLKTGNKPRSDYDTTFTSMELSFTYNYKGYGEETLWCWLEDNAGNVNHNNAKNFVVRRDTLPPGPPESIYVYPDTWTRNDSFILYLSYPTDLSGIKSVLIKTFNPPSSPLDTTKSSPLTSTIPIVLKKEGVIPAYVWLEDSAGLFGDYAFINMYRDTSSPIMSSITYTDTIKNETPVNYTFTIVDSLSGYTTSRVELKYPDTSSMLYPVFSGSTWNITLSSYNIEMGGVPIIEAMDNVGNLLKRGLPLPLFQKQNGMILDDSLGNPLTVHFASDTISGFLFSIPYPININIEEFLSYSDIDSAILFSTDASGLSLLDKNDSLSPGKAYFIWEPLDSIQIKIPPGIFCLDDTIFQLKKGWNPFGPELPYPVSIKHQESDRNNFMVAWVWDNGWHISSKFEPLKGYLIYSSIDTSFNYRIPSNFFLPDTPYIQISGYYKDFKDEDNYILMADDFQLLCPEQPFFKLLSINNGSILSADSTISNIFKINYSKVPDSIIISLRGNSSMHALVIDGGNFWDLKDYTKLKLLSSNIKIFVGPWNKILSEVAKEQAVANFSRLVSRNFHITAICPYFKPNIDIYDVTGRRIASAKMDGEGLEYNANIPIRNSGVYFFIIRAYNRILSRGRFISCQ